MRFTWPRRAWAGSGLVDFDVVDYSNLQRQILHGTEDVGRKKINSARDRIRAANPNVQVDLHDCLFSSDNARRIVEGYDIVIDGTDNFPTRYLSNDICVFLKKPNIYGSIFRFEGQCTVFAPHLGGPCYRCMFPEPPPPGMVPSCAEGGVLGVLPGIIGVMQAIEAVKLIVGIGEPLIGRLVHFDALKMKFREFKLRRDPKCPVCSEHPTIRELIDYDQFCGVPQAAAAEAAEEAVPTISASELKRKMDGQENFLLLDIREKYEFDIARLPGAETDPAGTIARVHERAGQRAGDRADLQDGPHQRPSVAPAARGGFRQTAERQRRHRSLGERSGPQCAQVLTRARCCHGHFSTMPTEVLAADLIEILRCPQTGLPLAVAGPELLAEVNARITHPAAGEVRNRAGTVVREPMDGALLPSDGSALYPVRDGIPVLLIDEAVPLPLP